MEIEVIDVARELDGFLAARALTQRELAKLLRCTRSQVSHWMAGKLAVPLRHLVQLGNIADYPQNLVFWKAAGIATRRVANAEIKAVKESASAN